MHLNNSFQFTAYIIKRFGLPYKSYRKFLSCFNVVEVCNSKSSNTILVLLYLCLIFPFGKRQSKCISLKKTLIKIMKLIRYDMSLDNLSEAKHSTPASH